MGTPIRCGSLLVLTLVAVGVGGCEDFDDFFDPDPEDTRYTVTLLSDAVSGGNVINNQDWVAGFSTRSDGTEGATVWIDGTELDLGTLGGPNSGVIFGGLNDDGMVVGIAETAEIDSLGQDFSCSFFFPGAQDNVCRGFAWASGEMTPMPTLGGSNSFAAAANDLGQVVGWAETDVHGPTCDPAAQELQFKGVVWEPKTGEIRALPPLPGDSVSTGNAINNQGQIVGISGDCGVAVGGVSATHAVLWEGGTPTEIGDLGGVGWHTPLDINEQGDVVGFSNPPGDGSGAFNVQAFFWTVGSHTVQNLGTLPGHTNSQGLAINEHGQIVGVSTGPDERSAVLWLEGPDGGPTDLNTLVKGFAGHLRVAGYINDAGVITGRAVDPGSGELVTYIARPVKD